MEVSISGKAGIFNYNDVSLKNDLDTNHLKNYESILNELSVDFIKKSPYLFIGNFNAEFEWVLHISVIKRQFKTLLETILPMLLNLEVSFLVPENSAVHTIILDGGLGYYHIGKVISIYPQNKDDGIIVAKELINLTKSFLGPNVQSAFHLGGNLYTNLIGETSFIPSRNLVRWPFASITKPKWQKQRRKIKQYVIVQQLKGDAKGNVYKCLNIKNWLNIQWCVIKQGKLNQCADDHGRTIKDRLKWQYQLLKNSEGLIALPKAIEYFEENDDFYLVIEYIKGENFYEKINSIQQGTSWPLLPIDSRRQILNYILETITIINKFHGNGLIHRDINPGNFMIREDGSIVAIDIELAYDYRADIPSPPFPYGTPGYISPQQQIIGQPDISDDIFGLGSLMLKVITGISPGKFNISDFEQLFKNLKFFIGNNALTAMIASCLDKESSLRPGLNSIRHTLEVYDALLLTGNGDKEMVSHKNFQVSELKEVIQKAVNTFGTQVLKNISGLWVSKSANEDNGIANEFKNYTWNPGLANGVSGTLYVLALAEKLKFDTVDLYDSITLNYQNLLTNSSSNLNIQNGLFHGNIGTSIATNAMIISGLLENTIYNNELIYQKITGPVTGLNIATGIAGQGLAYLYCANNPNLPVFYDQLSNIIATLINEQQSDGSWLIKNNKSQSKGIKHFGFAHGISGITYFLIEYYKKYEDQEVKTSVVKALGWLLNQRKLIAGNLIWTISPKNENVDPWIEFGFSGVALCFVKAFEVFKDLAYKEAAVASLMSHPKYISSNYLTLANGLAGLGEVYLEAFKTFKEMEWLDRSGNLVDILLHCYRQSTGDSVYWLEGNYSQPGADLMSGNSGILHFLLHYYNPEKVGFPLP